MHHVSHYFRYIAYNYCSLFCNDCVLQLFVKRMKVATDAEKEVLHKLDANFMSDEEDGEDDQSGLWIVRSPAWRSRRLTSLINSLQQRVKSRPLLIQATPGSRESLLPANHPQARLHGLFQLLGSKTHHQKDPKILPHHSPPPNIFPQGEGMMMIPMMVVKMTGLARQSRENGTGNCSTEL